jgi:integrase
MASVCNDPRGKKRILFFDESGERKVIRLGKCSAKQAEAFKVRLENLITARLGGGMDDEAARWVAGMDDGLHAKLAGVGLVQPRASKRLGEYLDQYISERRDLKENSLIVLRQSRQNLIDHFGAEKPLREITEADAEQWRLYMVGLGLSEATIRKRCGNAKQFFRAAVKRKLVPADPFTELESSAKANKKREYFVSRQDAQKVLDACPDAEWRLIFALCRFGGVRCPSEVLTLRWTDVNWGQSRMLVHSPKTEHHEGGESRLVPLFPELAPYLHAAFAEAEPGDGYVITRYRQANSNLRTQLKRIIHKAGLKPWPRLFQNLRSTRETELTTDFPLHVVVSWLGNSQLVARKHYLQVTDEHFARAAQNEAHLAQKEAQQASATPCMVRQENLQETLENADTLTPVGANQAPIIGGMGDEGIEPSTAALRVRCSAN